MLLAEEENFYIEKKSSEKLHVLFSLEINLDSRASYRLSAPSYILAQRLFRLLRGAFKFNRQITNREIVAGWDLENIRDRF
jgi:hypothetical protein